MLTYDGPPASIGTHDASTRLSGIFLYSILFSFHAKAKQQQRLAYIQRPDLRLAINREFKKLSPKVKRQRKSELASM
ncbi:MAG TPA: hypothetical protein VGO47_11130 [Chlamydiales bacterium]|nr:hypothetical protein [Chlamydiales bacterium]